MFSLKYDEFNGIHLQLANAQLVLTLPKDEQRLK